MSAITYTRLELRRSVRNRRFFFVSIGLPVVFFIVFATTVGNQDDFGGAGVSGVIFYLAGLISFATMAAMIGGGVRISVERATGWNRQLRLSPLKPFTYFASKVLVSYVVMLSTVVLLSVIAVAIGGRMTIGNWFEMIGLVVIAAVPFAGLGIGVSHLVTPDAMGAITGGSVGLLAFLGGSWFPLSGTLQQIGEVLPAYWIAAAGRTAAGGPAWSLEGWIVEAAWILATSAFALWAYQRDTKRV